MAHRLRGTIAASGTVLVGFNGTTTPVSVVRAANGSFDTALPASLDTALDAGGVATMTYNGQTINQTISPTGTGGNTGGGSGIGVVGSAPPIYSGTATLAEIQNSDGKNGLSYAHYGNGTVEYLWRAPAAFNVASGDKYELVVGNVIKYRDNNANAFLINGTALGTPIQASVRVVRDNGAFGPAYTITVNL